MPLATIEEGFAAVARGACVIVVDEASPESAGGLVMAAEKVTPAAVAFLVRQSSGVIWVSLTGERLDQLELPLMVARHVEASRSAYTVSVDARRGTSTGISAADRATTILALVDPATEARDLARPGHIFPLRYREGGVLKRARQAEAALDLVRLAGLHPAAVLCRVVNDDGNVARFADLERLAAEHGLLMVSIADLIRYRREREKLVELVATARLPTRWGAFTAHVYQSLLDGVQHLALVKGSPEPEIPTLVRVHAECLTGDIFGSMVCECGANLERALERIGAPQTSTGVVVYLRGAEGRDARDHEKLRLATEESGGESLQSGPGELDDTDGITHPSRDPMSDTREYGLGAQILADLGVGKMRLLSNTPSLYPGLTGFGLEIVERIPLAPASAATTPGGR